MKQETHVSSRGMGGKRKSGRNDPESHAHYNDLHHKQHQQPLEHGYGTAEAYCRWFRLGFSKSRLARQVIEQWSWVKSVIGRILFEGSIVEQGLMGWLREESQGRTVLK